MSSASAVRQSGNFEGKQFDQAEVAEKVVEQYDELQARVFYKYVMGGGGLDIHYGIYRNPTDSVYEASKETNNRLLTMLDWTYPLTPESVVLDLGSGHGGLSHECAKKYGCKVIGVNISPEQNKMNMEEAAKLGLEDNVEVLLHNINDGLPPDWTNKFTHVLSCEVLCHIADKEAAFKELVKVLKPGGAFCFTDIMGADGIDEKLLKDFTDRNATTKMARPSDYKRMLENCSFQQISFFDCSPHLEHYFQSQADQVTKHKQDMMNEGVAESYLDDWMKSLTSRVKMQKESKVFAWGFFSSRIDGPVY